jgi:hypothetical protein
MVLTIVVLAKLSGEDKPSGIAEWGKNHGEEIVNLMQLKKPQMPSLNTYRCTAFSKQLDHFTSLWQRLNANYANWANFAKTQKKSRYSFHSSHSR